MSRVFRYDAAFSFLQADESLALRLAHLLSPRISTFVYSERQADIAGKDGEATFNRVFGSEARVVVVLHRKEWGHTRWTRIEATAIRNRAFEQGYDFTIFIPLDSAPIPDYVPRTRLWVGLSRWGEDGAASVIEARVQEAGGEPHEESLAEKAARVATEKDASHATEEFLRSVAGVEAAKQEVERTFSEVETFVQDMTSVASTLSIRFQREWPVVVVNCGSKSLLFSWHVQWANSLDGSGLHIWLFEGHYSLTGIRLSEPRELSKWVLHLDRHDGNVGWRQFPGSSLLGPKDAAKKFLEILLERAGN